MNKEIITNTVLTIAGSDSGGGAGIQADLKVYNTLKVHGLTAITAITAQNPSMVNSVQILTKEVIVDQIKTVASYFPINAVKTGMLANKEIVIAVADELAKLSSPIVVDPVMVSTSGCSLLEPNACEVIINRLFPLATVITPNLPEAELILNKKIDNLELAISAAKTMRSLYKTNIVLKGGHRDGDKIVDIVATNDDKIFLVEGNRINANGTHGTGCTLSSAIASFLAQKESVFNSIINGIKYVRTALQNEIKISERAFNLGNNIDLQDDICIVER